MKVIALNGSPHANGNTYTALKLITEVLEKSGIETEILNVGNKPITGCKACGACSKTGRCVINDGANEIIEKAREVDGIIVGSPVYYAGINGTLKSFLDRLFYTSASYFRFKPCAAVVALRRSGAVATMQAINNYFTFAEMIITPSLYWNGIHGAAQGEASQDTEGVQIMENIGTNMAYLLEMIEQSNIPVPEKPEKIKFNYIR